MTLIEASLVVSEDAHSNTRIYGMFSCDNCEVPSVGLRSFDIFGSGGQPNVVLEANVNMWLPHRAAGKVYGDVPGEIADIANEAHMCASIDAHRAAIICARAALEAVCKNKGATSGTLFEKIGLLHKDSLITDAENEEAHAIRSFGNDMAHGDLDTENPVTSEDVEEVLGYMASVLETIYQGPARVEHRKAIRASRKAGCGYARHRIGDIYG